MRDCSSPGMTHSLCWLYVAKFARFQTNLSYYDQGWLNQGRCIPQKLYKNCKIERDILNRDNKYMGCVEHFQFIYRGCYGAGTFWWRVLPVNAGTFLSVCWLRSTPGPPEMPELQYYFANCIHGWSNFLFDGQQGENKNTSCNFIPFLLLVNLTKFSAAV